MCIACVLQKGADISEDEFLRCWRNNPDGGGFAMIEEDGSWLVQKSMNLEEFKGMFQTAWQRRKKYSPALLHFRVGTRGTKDEFNCHPFPINPHVMMMHNGVIAGLKYTDNNKSDTHTYATEYLAGQPYNFLANQTTLNLIEHSVGDNNKIAFLDKRNGQFTLVNKGKWIVDGERVFSNSMFKEYRQPKANVTHFSNYSSGQLKECNLCHHWFLGKDYNNMWSMCDEHVAAIRLFIKSTGSSEFEAKKVWQEAADFHYKPEREAFLKFRAERAKEEKSKATPEGDDNEPEVGEMKLTLPWRHPISVHGMTAEQYEEMARVSEFGYY